MATKVKPVPEGYHTVTPYLAVRNAADAIGKRDQAEETPRGDERHPNVTAAFVKVIGV